MATRTQYTCDRCKVESFMSKNWMTVKLEVDRLNYNHYNLCPECSAKLGLVMDSEADKTKPKPVETIKDRLFDVIEEIVRINMEV